MKAIVTLLAAAGFAFSGVAAADEALATAKGCLACHKADVKVVGPAYKDVAKKYAAKDTDLLVKHIMDGTDGKIWNLGVPMPKQNVTKEEATKLVKWILSLK